MNHECEYLNLRINQHKIKQIGLSLQEVMHIIRNEFGKMIGRVNFFNIRIDEIKSAELGYRIGKSENGKGYATEAVRIALKKGFRDYKFAKVEAGTSPDNIGSQIVLENNGFVLTKKIEKDVKVNGKWVDSLIYEKEVEM